MSESTLLTVLRVLVVMGISLLIAAPVAFIANVLPFVVSLPLMLVCLIVAAWLQVVRDSTSAERPPSREVLELRQRVAELGAENEELLAEWIEAVERLSVLEAEAARAKPVYPLVFDDVTTGVVLACEAPQPAYGPGRVLARLDDGHERAPSKMTFTREDLERIECGARIRVVYRRVGFADGRWLSGQLSYVLGADGVAP